MIKIYYDETNHHRKIGVNKKNNLRFNTATEFFFMHCFMEIDDTEINKFSILENEFKKEIRLPEDKELKSKHIVPKNLLDISEKQFLFLKKFIDVFETKNRIFNIGYINKIDPFSYYCYSMKKIIENTPKFWRYSLDKYLSVRRMEDLNILLSNDISMKNIYSRIIIWLKKDIEKTKRTDEKKVFKNLIAGLKEFKSFDKRMWTTDKLDWDYSTIMMSLASILDERKARNIYLIYDSFEEIKKNWDLIEKHWKNEVLKFNSQPSFSKNEVGLRIVDILIGLIRKTILSLCQQVIKNRKVYNTNISFDTETIKFINQNKDIFIFIKNLFGNDYWSTFTSIYSDDFLMFGCVIKTISDKKDITRRELDALYAFEINKRNQIF